MVAQSFSVAKPKLQTAVLKYEAFPDYCRESAVLLAGDGAKREIEIGTVLGMANVAAVPTVAPDAGNTGDGVLTLATPATGAGVVFGAYKAICIEPGANAGVFEVFDPDGVSVGTATVAVAFDGVVKFTIADGAADFIAGDSIDIVMAAGDGKVVALDPAAVDGTGNAWGVAISKSVAANGVDASVLALRRGPAILAEDGLVWPDGISADDQAAAVAALESMSIVIRPS